MEDKPPETHSIRNDYSLRLLLDFLGFWLGKSRDKANRMKNAGLSAKYLCIFLSIIQNSVPLPAISFCRLFQSGTIRTKELSQQTIDENILD
jgi:hypothetical protein